MVPSPAVSFVLEATSCSSLAPRFSNLSFRVIALATVTPSFGYRLARISHQCETTVRYTMARTLCNLGRAIARLDQNISALGTECCRDSLRKSLDTDKKRSSSLNSEFELLCELVSTAAKHCRLTNVLQRHTASYAARSKTASQHTL